MKKEVLYYKLERLSKVADYPGERAKLTWGIRNGYPRATVSVFENQRPVLKKMVPCNMSPDAFGSFIQAAEEAIDGDNDVSIVNYNRRFEESTGRNTGEKYQTSTLTLDATGDIVKLVVVDSEKGGKYEFPFELSEYHKLYENGKEVDRKRSSKILAYGYLGLVKTILAMLMVSADIIPNGQIKPRDEKE